MGCGSKINEKDIIVKLLNSEYSDFTLPKDNEISCWNLTINLNNIVPPQSKSVNNKSKSKSNNLFRVSFGYKSNNKVNNFNFQNHASIEDHIIQYRNENKATRCLSKNPDLTNFSESFNKPQRELINSIITDIYPLKPEPPEKSLIQQVRFWRNQNTDLEKYRQIPIESNDVQRPVGPQIIGSLPVSTIATSYGQRSSFHNKRSLDMIVPQGTTYDILSDDNRISGNAEIDKLNVNIKDRTQSLDGLGLVSIPYHSTRETTKIRSFNKEGGSLEFAKLLDEKLRALYEQRNVYQPSMEFNRFKQEIKPKKPVSRQKSANFQMRNDYLTALSVNGKSTGGAGRSVIVSVPKTAEDQWNFFTPCLLPQMPAFGTQNFPRFISSTVNFGSSSIYFNNNLRYNPHEE